MDALFGRIQSVLEEACSFRRAAGRPYVTLSYAQSIDGSIAYRPGRPLALSSSAALVFTHRLRAAHQGILVGIGTILADDPLLTVRLAPGENPQPVILDSRLRLPLEARVLRNGRAPLVIATQEADPAKEEILARKGARVWRLPANSGGFIDLAVLLQNLAADGMDSLMVEGGAQIITSFLRHRLVDQVVLTLAPILVGGVRAVEPLHFELPSLPRLRNEAYAPLGADLVLHADVCWGEA